MNEISLKIDIQTILKLVKFNESFRMLFKKLSFFDGGYDRVIDEYVVYTNILNKNMLWQDLSTIDNIPEINFIISIWRKNEKNWEKVERDIQVMKESDVGHCVVGKVIQFDDLVNYKKLVLEGKNQSFQYNGFKILPTSDKFLQLFF